MKQTAIILVVLGTFITGNPSASADSGNPFGFETDKHPLKYEYCKKEPGLYRGHGYECSSAPRPHPDFKEYALQFVEGIGLCFIAAVHPNFSYDTLQIFKDQIAKKYESPTGVRYANPDNSYPLEYAWGPKSGFKGLGDIKAINLKSDGGTNTVLYFWLVTDDACQKEIDDKADRAF